MMCNEMLPLARRTPGELSRNMNPGSPMNVRRSKNALVAATLCCLFLAATAIGLGACDEGVSGGNNGFSEEALAERQQIASSIGDHVVMPLLEACRDDAAALQSAVEAYEGTPDEETRSAAQQAWVTAFRSWQRCELLQFGPAAMATTSAGGMDMRDPIYSWPLSNACVIDIATVDQSYVDGELAEELNVNARGLDALEYLLFVESSENTCAPNNRINAEGTWDAIDTAEVQTRRRAYALRVANEVAAASAALFDEWDSRFLDELKGQGTGVYGNAQQALNAISDAMFYLEKETKDMKAAIPAGIAGCPEETCLDQVESLYAQQSLEAIVANIEAFAMLYYGGDREADTPGFDDLLRSIGAVEIAETVEAQIAESLQRFEELPTPLETTITAEREDFEAAFDVLRELNVTLKTSFVSVLDLELPQRAEGDND